jgi:hypothetical protein
MMQNTPPWFDMNFDSSTNNPASIFIGAAVLIILIGAISGIFIALLGVIFLILGIIFLVIGIILWYAQG